MVGCEVWGGRREARGTLEQLDIRGKQTMAGEGGEGEHVHSLQLKVTSWHKTSPEGLNYCTMTQ